MPRRWTLSAVLIEADERWSMSTLHLGSSSPLTSPDEAQQSDGTLDTSPDLPLIERFPSPSRSRRTPAPQNSAELEDSAAKSTHAQEPGGSQAKIRRRSQSTASRSKKRQQVAPRLRLSVSESQFEAQYTTLAERVERAADKLYQAGLGELNKGNSEVALNYLATAIELKPGNPAYIGTHCDIFCEANRPDTALQLALDARSSLPSMPVDFLLRIARYQFRLGLFDDVAATLLETIASFPSDLRARASLPQIQEILRIQTLAQERQKAKDYTELVAMVDRLETLYGDSIEMWRQWRSEAEATLVTKRLPKTSGLATLKGGGGSGGATRACPSAYHFAEAERLLGDGQQVAAARLYDVQLRSLPDHLASRRRLYSIGKMQKGDDAMILGLSESAIGDFEKAISMDPTAPNITSLLVKHAHALYASGMPAPAIDDCNKALDQDPSNYRALHLRGLCLVALDHLEPAVNDLEAALAAYNQKGPRYNERADWQNIVEEHLTTAHFQLAGVESRQF